MQKETAAYFAAAVYEEVTMPFLRKNEIIPLQIIDITNEGYGVGHFEGHAVFVPYTAINDFVKCKIVKPGKKYSYGIIDEIEIPSSCRISSDCSAYTKCGGCCYRHITYENELQIKQKQVEDAMRRIGKIDFEISSILPSPLETHYRNKVVYPVQKVNTKTTTGFFAGRSHRFIPISKCLLSPLIIDEIAEFICRLIDEYNILIYAEDAHKGLLRNLYFRQASISNKIVVCFVINGTSLPHSKEICQRVIENFPMVSGILLNINTKQTNVVLSNKFELIFGDDLLQDTLADVKLLISPASFYQVNHSATECLYRTVKKYAYLKKDDTLLDLYCGVGSIGLSLANSCKNVIGVEIVESAIMMAKENARLNNLTNAKFVCADAGAAADLFLQDGLLPDVVILDPPRKGCDILTLESVVKMHPKRIVMVSCNPATAARDANYLSQNNYRVSGIQPVDMFPRTKHVECVICFENTPT